MYASRMEAKSKSDKNTIKLDKSDTDHRKYRMLTLDNGLRVILVSDLKPGETDEDESDSSSSGSDSDSDSGKEREMARACLDDDENNANDGQGRPSGKQKAAASLCVAVGGFNDPPELQGLAHYMEHMVFMGSKKYPSENDFDSYISQRGGETNAWTDAERTNFYFDVRRRHFYESLDRFANFFIDPLLDKSSLDRELTAVHSEYEMQVSNDSFVIEQLLSTFSKEGSPFRTFQSGNKISLRDTPKAKGINVHEYLHDLRKRMYSAHFMTLSIQAKDDLDHMEEMTRTIFGGVPNNGLEKPSLKHHKDPFDTKEFRNFYLVAPVKDKTGLKISWNLPSVLEDYECQPTGVLGFVIGHEAKGSLISYLRKKNLALELTAGASRLPDCLNNSFSCIFTIYISLTDEGYDAVDEVVRQVFAYLAMFRQSGVDKRLFTEFQQLSANRFRFNELEEPVETVEYLAQALHCFATPHLLSGPILVYQYKPQLYQQLLDLLTADKANFMLVARRHDDQCKTVEPWYNGRYTLRDLSPQVKEEWISMKPMDHFHLPKENKFIATNFDILPVADEDVHPRNLIDPKSEDSKFGSLWYKRDRHFKVPKAVCFLQIWSNLGHESLSDNVLNDLFVYALDQDLKETVYDAEEASLDYDITSLRSGIRIKLDGFNDKLFILFQTVIDEIENFKVDPDKFISHRESNRQIFTNLAYKPYKLGENLQAHLMEDTTPVTLDKLSVLETLTPEALTEFHKKFLKTLKMDLYLHGNVSEEQAKEFFQYAKKKLNFTPLSDVIRTKTVQLPIGLNKLRVMNMNPVDVNTAVFNCYQLGLGTIKLLALNQLLGLVLQEPCFDFLRTKETLGYQVYLDNACVSGCLSISVLVVSQADKFSIDHCQKKMDEFLLKIAPKIVSKLSSKDFNTYIDTLIAMKMQEDVHMGTEASRNWKEIIMGSNMFDHRHKMIESLKTLKKADLVSFFRKYYLESNAMKKLIVQVDSHPDAKSKTPPTPNKSFHLDLNVMRGSGEPTDNAWMLDFKEFKKNQALHPYHRIME